MSINQIFFFKNPQQKKSPYNQNIQQINLQINIYSQNMNLRFISIISLINQNIALCCFVMFNIQFKFWRSKKCFGFLFKRSHLYNYIMVLLWFGLWSIY